MDDARHAPRWLRRLGRRLLDDPRVQAQATELGYRFRRRAIDCRLEEAHRLPRALHLEATNVCNARCVFCAYPRMERPKETMPMALFADVVDQYVALGGSHVSLTPIVGDPFVDPHLFERLDDLSRRDEIRGFYFFTNAILMTRERSRRLLVYGERLRVCVSMGGFDHQSYARLMGAGSGFALVWVVAAGAACLLAWPACDTLLRRLPRTVPWMAGLPLPSSRRSAFSGLLSVSTCSSSSAPERSCSGCRPPWAARRRIPGGTSASPPVSTSKSAPSSTCPPPTVNP